MKVLSLGKLDFRYLLIDCMSCISWFELPYSERVFSISARSKRPGKAINCTYKRYKTSK